MAENERDPRSAQAQAGAEQTRKDEQGTEKVRAEQQSGERTHDRPVFRPRVDIYETNDGLVLAADIPGVTADGLNITLENGSSASTGA